jgi:uncharacterized protein YqjF (DUF2071 family)
LGRPAAYHQWRRMLFLHWSVPVEQLRPLVPAELELDLWKNQAYVGFVAFALEQVHPWWWPRQLAFSFLELNLRTYVLFRDVPGIYFFSLDASNRLAAWWARHFWHLPYYYSRVELSAIRDIFEFCSRRRGCSNYFFARYRIAHYLGPSAPGTLEFFLLERYVLFTKHRGAWIRVQVSHPPYPAHVAEVLECEQDFLQQLGLRPCSDRWTYAHFVPGVDVRVFGPRPAGG